jgi:hypothetical protein
VSERTVGAAGRTYGLEAVHEPARSRGVNPMPALRSRRAPRAITAALATTAVALATAAPGLAQPAGEGAAQSAKVVAHRHSAAGDLRSEARTSSLAGTTEDNVRGLDVTAVDTRTPVSGGGGGGDDDGGLTTLAVVLIGAGALAAGASAGVAGSRGLRRRALT